MRGRGGLIGQAIGFLFMAAVVAVVLFYAWAVENPLWAAVLYPSGVWCCWWYVKTYKRLEREKLEARLRDEHVPSMSPAEYERLVALKLEQAGWRVKSTGRAGDQGCDVLAELGGFTAVVQVKLWRKAVGNAAVQEVVAARHHYGAQVMVVVAPNGYSKGARELAASNGVHLISHTGLAGLAAAARIP